MTNYITTRSITTDFGGNYDSDIFESALADETGFSIPFTMLGGNDDSIIITFTGGADLVANDETLIDALISGDTFNTSIKYAGVLAVHLSENKLDKSDYQTICRFKYPGSDNIGTIAKIIGTGYNSKSGESMTIVVIDRDTGNEIALATFSNTSDADLDLGTISNVPLSLSNIEIKGKVSDDKNDGNITSMTIFLL